MREDGWVRRLWVVLREKAPEGAANSAGVDAAALANAATIFRTFGERYHEQLLEEQHIFPIVRKAGGEGGALVDTLLAQHARGRAITDYILDRRSEEHTSELQSLMRISYAVFCLKKKKIPNTIKSKT